MKPGDRVFVNDAERDRCRYALTAIKMLHEDEGCARIARAALDRGTP